jgi:ankyrin repeat protein
MHHQCRIVILGCLAAVYAMAIQAQDISQSVFEVVVAKPAVDKLSYRERLPLELLPYQERNDPYRSIGTAFAIGENRFVTAAHVLSPDAATLQGSFGLRDSQGKLHAIGQVLSYSKRRDYLEFTVPDLAAVPLPVSREYRLNGTVRTVGNALGEGIIIREGTLTSTTPEDQDGEWRWLRFSAAASPGNSGGPLLDADGKAIGVVVMKSSNENLNYALPFAEAPRAGTGHYALRYRYALPYINQDLLRDDAFDLALPMAWPEFRSALSGRATALMLEAGGILAADHPKLRFPLAPKSAQFVNTTFFNQLPQVVRQKPDDSWELKSPEKTSHHEIGTGGSLDMGGYGDFTLFSLQTPEGVPAAGLLDTPRLFMDTFLGGYLLNRNVGSKQIRITSLGEAADAADISDRWGRRWRAFSWTIDAADYRIILYVLPTPRGAAGIWHMGHESQSAAIRLDMRYLLDNVMVSYIGSLKDWQAFLAKPERLPDAMQGMSLDLADPGSPRLATRLFELRVDAAAVPLSGDGRIFAMGGVFTDGAAPHWEIGRLFGSSGTSDGPAFDLYRRLAPDASAAGPAKEDWGRVLKEAYPYDGKPWEDDGRKFARNAAQPTEDGSLAKDPKLVWNLQVSAAAGLSDRVVYDMLLLLRDGLRLAPAELQGPGGGQASRLVRQDGERLSGKTLFDAIKADDTELLGRFLDRKSRLEVRDADGRTPLAAAARLGKAATVQRLLAAGAQAVTVDRSSQNALHLAVLASSADTTRLLIGARANLDARDYRGMTPLLLSLSAGQEACARLLLETGADCRSVAADGRGAVGLALAGGLEVLVPELLARGAPTDGADSQGWTPLMYALRHGSDASVKLLMDRRPELHRGTALGWNALHVAARWGRTAWFAPLVAGGLSPTAATKAGETPLMLAGRNTVAGDDTELRRLIGP